MLERAVKPWRSLTKLQAGQAIAISVEQGQVQSIAFELAFATLLRATRDQSHWQVTEHQLASKKTIKHLSGTIETSFFVDAIKMGIPQDIINQSIVNLMMMSVSLYEAQNLTKSIKISSYSNHYDKISINCRAISSLIIIGDHRITSLKLLRKKTNC